MDASPCLVKATRTGLVKPASVSVCDTGSFAPAADVHAPCPGTRARPSAGTAAKPTANSPSRQADTVSAASPFPI